jgi:hydrogenase maturation protease
VKELLAYGFGNPGRQDDGLGIRLVERWQDMIESSGICHIAFEYAYQLNIEDAHTISEYDKVVFVDASVAEIDHLTLTKVQPNPKTEFTMHAMHPEFILHLCQKLYNKMPETSLLSIKGYEFEFGEPFTAMANKNLDMALHLVLEVFSMPLPADIMASLENEVKSTVL